jgi:hypothetical protein
VALGEEVDEPISTLAFSLPMHAAFAHVISAGIDKAAEDLETAVGK